jgi:hypothetical protein
MKSLVALALLALAVPAHAKLVTIEPDDFIGKGAILSPYVVIRSIDQGIYSAVTATTSLDGFDAPTGKAVFRSASVAEQIDGRPFHGFSVEFLVPVRRFEIGVVNTTYEPSNGLDCILWNSTIEFHYCDARNAQGGFFNAVYGVPGFAVITDTARISQVLLGGGDMIGGMRFDRLSFEVPEPTTFALFAAGLLGLLALPKKRSPALGRARFRQLRER